MKTPRKSKSGKKQVVANPTGKGGFGDNPENINEEGRPDNGWTWRDLYMKELEKDSEKRAGFKKKESIVAANVAEAEKGSIPHIKEISDRTDGKAPISAGHYEGGAFKPQSLVVVYGSDD